MQRATWAAKEYSVKPIKKMVGPLAPTRYQNGHGFGLLQVMLIALAAFLIGLAVASYGTLLKDVLLQSAEKGKLEVKMSNLTSGNGYVLDGLSGLLTTR